MNTKFYLNVASGRDLSRKLRISDLLRVVLFPVGFEVKSSRYITYNLFFISDLNKIFLNPFFQDFVSWQHCLDLAQKLPGSKRLKTLHWTKFALPRNLS